MKKARPYLHFLLVAFYLLSSVGIPVYYHYCGGELESISALVKADSCCGGEDMEEDPDCCQNEMKVLVQFNESLPAEKYVFSQLPALIPAYLVLNEFQTIIEKNEPFFLFLSPYPPDSGRSLLLNKSVLII